MESGEGRAKAFGETEINWDKLDKTKFYVGATALFSGITVILHPTAVIKTRLQIASKDVVEKTAFATVKNILKSDGIPGLYRGFGTIVTGLIPSRIVSTTVVETTKLAAFRVVEPLNVSEPSKAAIANGFAGLMGSICSQAVFVPVEVVSQKLMVQGYSGNATYDGGMDVIRKIMKTGGIRGLYKGFGLSLMSYAPSSATWWASYGSSQRIFWNLLGYNSDSQESPSVGLIVCVQAAGGIVAGTTASCVTTPLDTIKTRLQVTGLEKRQNATQVVKALMAEEGWKGLFRGLGTRCFTMCAWGTSMTLGYEYLKRLSIKE